MSLWIDGTLGKCAIGFASGIKMEMVATEVSNDISVDNTFPTTLNQLCGFVGQFCCSYGDVSRKVNTPISNMSACNGTMEISVGDVSAGVDTANTSLNYIAWGW